MKFKLANKDELDQINRWMPELGNYYDGHEGSKFFEQISNKENKDPFGFFTLKKEIWVASDENALLGFICLNYKRGGSVKIGPIMVNPDSRGKGVGKFLINNTIEMVRSTGMRKLYATTSSLNHPACSLFKNSGFSQEAVLPNQYRQNTEEYIWGLFLIESTRSLQIKNSLLSKNETEPSETREYVDKSDRKYLDDVVKIIKEWHNDIDEEFTKGVIDADSRELDYEIKGKKIFVSLCKDKQNGMAVTTPKRGGAVKVYPIYGSIESQKSLICEIKSFYQQRNFRKLYTFSPAQDSKHHESLKNNGFTHRGILRSPYKDGYDITVLDMNI